MIESLLARLRARLAAWRPLAPREEHRVRGMRVIVENTRADIATADVLARLDDALALIERHQPWRLRHLQRDVAQLLVARFPCRGAYFPAQRTCLTELTFLARRDISAATVASSILHEGIHARVASWRARGGSLAEPDMAREERLCRMAELDFGRALPPGLGDPVVQRALASLALADDEVAPAIDWELAQRRVDDADAAP
jgi:hypothetical protein